MLVCRSQAGLIRRKQNAPDLAIRGVFFVMCLSVS